MRLYRLCKARWAATALSGEGALRYPGRWHFAGTPVVYMATSRSLAALELLVHMEIRHAPPSFVVIAADVPDDSIAVLDDLPPDWNALPPGESSRRVGTAWVRSNASLGLKVPSVVVRGEHNVLLNPLHPGFNRVVVSPPESFAFDPRVLSSVQR